MATVSVKAPGKILWIGGYSVLERPNVSYVSTVDAYVTATLKTREDDTVELNAPQLKASAKGAVEKSTGKMLIDAPKELLLFKTAAEVASRYIVGLGLPISGFSITTNNDGPFAYSLLDGNVVKSGLGSSAAVTVATVGAVLKAFGVGLYEKEAINKISQTAHSIATGKIGSGFDIAAATFGSILYLRYSPDTFKALPTEYTNVQLVALIKKSWDYKIEKFALPKEFRLLFANFGESMITTQAIGNMSEFKKNDPNAYGKLVKKINDENVKAIAALRKIRSGEKDSLQEFREAFDKGRLLTKKLGELSNVAVEPDDCTELIEESKKNGAFVAKLPGAGGKDAISAITLDDKSYSSLKSYWSARRDIRVLDIKSSDKGVE